MVRRSIENVSLGLAKKINPSLMLVTDRVLLLTAECTDDAVVVFGTL